MVTPHVGVGNELVYNECPATSWQHGPDDTITTRSLGDAVHACLLVTATAPASHNKCLREMKTGAIACAQRFKSLFIKLWE